MTPPKRTRRYFSASLKRAVATAFKRGESTKAIAERMGIDVGNIRNWVKDTRMGPRRAPRGLAEKLRKAACANDACVNEATPEPALPLNLSAVKIILTSASLTDSQKVAIVKALIQ